MLFSRWTTLLNTLVEILPYPFIPLRSYQRLIRLLLRTEEPIEEQIKRASDSLTYAAEVTASLRITIEQQKSELQKVLLDYNRYKTMAGTEKDKIQAWLDEIGRTTKKERWIQIVVAIVVSGLFFLAGFLVRGAS